MTLTAVCAASLLNGHSDMFKLFRKPERGELTVIAADPSEGGDFCAAVAKSKKRNDSFMTFNERMDSSTFGYELNKMGKFIQVQTGEWPMLAVERNVGMATIAALDTLNYERLFRMVKMNEGDERVTDRGSENEDSKIGWITTADVRRKMLDELALSMRQRVNTIYDLTTVRQMMSFVNNNGKFEAASGQNDDLVICEAIAWQLIILTPHVRDKSSRMAKMARFKKQKLFDEHGIPNV